MKKKIIKKAKSMDVKDILVRSVKTFLQAFFGTLAVNIATVKDADTGRAALIAAAAAGIAAVWNTAKELIRTGKQ
jgi:hypothetical protein